MPTKKIKKIDEEYIRKLGKKVKAIILEEKGYDSLDQFALSHHDNVSKPTLYELCNDIRDIKLSTLRGLCRALKISLIDLLKDL